MNNGLKSKSKNSKKSKSRSKQSIKSNFKFSMERPNLPVATGMSEKLIYRPQNIDLIAGKLAELNQTDTESSK